MDIISLPKNIAKILFEYDYEFLNIPKVITVVVNKSV